MSHSDDTSSPAKPVPELGGLDPQQLLQIGLETIMTPAGLVPDLDATVRIAAPQASSPSHSQPELPLPEELTNLLPHGNYHVESFLGQGGMGAVYKGMQVRLKRPVAIKIMRRDMGKDYDFEARFEREAQAMAKLNHPNIVSVIDFGEAGADYLYIVMELIDGADLMDVIRGGQMTQEMALTLLPQVCDALQFAHDHGIVHRDIKPSNIMLTRDGRVKMCDFGLAKRYDVESSFRTQTGTGMGTPDYAAPEQFDPKANIDHRADIYALGVMIYQMITGQLPRGVWKPPSQRAEISPQWDDIVSRAMQSDPSDRYQQASEVKTDVSSIPLIDKEGSSGTPARPSSKGGAAAKTQEAVKSDRASFKSRAPLIFGLITGAVVIAAGAFFVLKKPAQSGPLSPLSGTNSKSSKPANTAGDVLPYVNRADQRTQKELPAGVWIPLKFTKEQEEPEIYTATPSGDLKLVSACYLTGLNLQDVAIRMHIRRPNQDKEAIVQLRGESRGGRELVLNYKGGFLRHRLAANSQESKILPLPSASGVERPALLEVAAIGSTTYGAVDSVPLPPMDLKAELVKPGRIRVQSENTEFIGIEFMILDGVPQEQWPDFVKTAKTNTPSPATKSTPPAPDRPNLPVSKSSDPKFPPGQWTDALQDSSGLSFEGQSKPTITLAGMQMNGPSRIKLERGPSRDGAVRIRTSMDTSGGGVSIRGRHSAANEACYTLKFSDNEARLGRMDDVTKPGQLLASLSLSPPYQKGQEYELELRIVGDRLTAKLDGKVIGDITDATLQTGKFAIVCDGGTPPLVKTVEYLNLDGLPEAEALRLLGVDEKGNDVRGKAGASAAAEKWEDLLATPEKLDQYKVEKITAGSLVLPYHASVWRKTEASDASIRMTATYTPQKDGPELFARCMKSNERYSLHVANTAKAALSISSESGYRTLKTFTIPQSLAAGSEYELELQAVGDLLVAKLNGETLGEVRDTTYPMGRFGVSCIDQTTTEIKALRFLSLDAPSKGSASPDLPASAASSATKDAPFINTLGMKFVPVPGTKVLFSIWETRVQDYEVFAKETKLEWKKPDFEQGPSHPAVMLSWKDAYGFCAWLTDRERKAGKIAANERYRLPNDHEWSCAVGIGDSEDPNQKPAEKSQKLSGVYPWGTSWPPPDDLNLSGEEARGHFTHTAQGFLSGHRDAFPTTAPVGSFQPNALGLFDLDGNVSEWCLDSLGIGNDERVVRGGSFFHGLPKDFLSSLRSGGATVWVSSSQNVGFRIVLGLEPTSTAQGSALNSAKTLPPASQASASFSSATKDAPFTNTLGIKLVPVPIGGGPTKGQRVLFSVWETRVQDYEMFVKETKREWKKPEFELTPLHPIMAVTWDDAVEFCSWLTERERKAGTLGSDECYRLPSDHEWSCAVGIGDREDPAATPRVKHLALPDVYPWGSGWPPPPGAGNFAGEELSPAMATGKFFYIKGVLTGYRDVHVATAPVGSFQPNQLGIHDLGGNVWEWCDDLYDAKNGLRMMRGGSWHDYSRENLVLSNRHTKPQTTSTSNIGFRVVLAQQP